MHPVARCLCLTVLAPMGEAGEAFATHHPVDPGFSGASSVAAADFDLDGRVDIAGAGHYEAGFAWWRNLGGDSWVRHEIASMAGAFANSSSRGRERASRWGSSIPGSPRTFPS